MLASADRVLALKPDADVLAGLDVGVIGPRGKVGVVGSRASGDGCAFEVRAFFPATTAWPKTRSPAASMPRWRNG